MKKLNFIIISIIIFIFLILIIITIILSIIFYNKNTCKNFLNNDEKLQLTKKFKNKNYIIYPTIFVAISSYRDSELCFTLKDLYDKSYNQERIFVGIVEQNKFDDNYTCFAKNCLPYIQFPNNVRIISFDYKLAKGPTYARHICEKLWKNENYYMMIDSHMRFEFGWDVELINMLFKCNRPKRTCITMYPESYKRIQINNNIIKHKIIKRKGWRYEQLKNFNEQGIIEFESISSNYSIPNIPNYVPMYAACFVFGHSDIIKLVPFHPNTPYLFFGEELFMAARLFTHGFDLVGPCFSVVYHLWDRSYRKTFWEHEIITERDKSIQLIKNIMNGVIIDEKYGLGSIRTINEFWDYLGVDFNKKKFTRKRKPWTLPKNFKILK